MRTAAEAGGMGDGGDVAALRAQESPRPFELTPMAEFAEGAAGESGDEPGDMSRMQAKGAGDLDPPRRLVRVLMQVMADRLEGRLGPILGRQRTQALPRHVDQKATQQTQGLDLILAAHLCQKMLLKAAAGSGLETGQERALGIAPAITEGEQTIGAGDIEPQALAVAAVAINPQPAAGLPIGRFARMEPVRFTAALALTMDREGSAQAAHQEWGGGEASRKGFRGMIRDGFAGETMATPEPVRIG